MMTKYPDELTCDMAETYGVFDIKRLPVRLAATLAVGLRNNSRVKRAMANLMVSENDSTVLLAIIADNLRTLVWSLTEDGQKWENRPVSRTEQYYGPKKKEQEQKEPQFQTFASPDEFKQKWAEVTRS